MKELRLALRRLWQSPCFTLSAILTLALGIGTTAALFTVVDAVLLRPLPFPQPEQLVSLRADLRGQGVEGVRFSVPELEDIRRRAEAFSEVAMVFPMSGNMTGIDRPERVEALAVTPNYFRLLGSQPLLGRTFGSDEERVSGWAEGIVLSHRAWQVLFGGDPAAIGRKVWMDYDTFHVVGVMPPSFRHPGSTLTSAVDVWFTGGLRSAPFAPQPNRAQRIIPSLVGRLKPGVTPEVAQARLAALAAHLGSEFPDLYPARAGWTPTLDPLLDSLTRRTRPVLLILLAASGCLLLICCSSIACLQLARAAGRAREAAIRTAIGATPWSLVRQCLVENALLSLASCSGALLFARWLIPALLALAPADLPRADSVSIEPRVLLFSLAVAGFTGLLLSLAPARHFLRLDVLGALKESGGGHAGGRIAARWRAGLVVAQIAISVVLLTAAGVLVRSLWNLLQENPGFRSKGVIVASIWLPPPTDPNARQTYRVPANRIQFMRSVAENLRSQPGVELAAIGAGQSVPFLNWRATDISLEEQSVATGAAPQVELANVTPDYFGVLGLPLRTGRLLRESDDTTNPVAVIDESAARRLWPDQDPLGRRFSLPGGPRPVWITVVGVVGNMKTDGFDAPLASHVYLSAYHRSGMDITILLRSTLPVGALAESIRSIVRSADPDLPVFNIRTLDGIVARTQAQRRFAFVVISFFAVAALTLAAVGIVGVTTLVVTQRRREFGVRMALGATGRQLAGLVYGQGLRLAIGGALVGAIPALALSHSLRALLYGVRPTDILTFVGISLLLLVTVFAATWPAARRASRSNPIEALRAD